MNLENRQNSFINLAENLKKAIQELKNSNNSVLNNCLNNAFINNPWFTIENSISALEAITYMLSETSIKQFATKYSDLLNNQKSKNISIIMAGNIPAVGFQDLFHVLLAGHNAIIKTSADDEVLIKYLVEELIRINSNFSSRISLVKKVDTEVDAVIATGSNNTARYFDFYYNDIPSIIRKNRNSIAVLRGDENIEELKLLADDVFKYFGFGCRNVSKIYLPDNYDFENLVNAFSKYDLFKNHSSYINNYVYIKALNEFSALNYIDCSFYVLVKNSSFNSPIAQVNFETFSSIEEVKQDIHLNYDQLQCVISKEKNLAENVLDFGMSQFPGIDDFADGINTFEFLAKL